jgi:hypothetical protein
MKCLQTAVTTPQRVIQWLEYNVKLEKPPLLVPKDSYDEHHCKGSFVFTSQRHSVCPIGSLIDFHVVLLLVHETCKTKRKSTQAGS